MLRADNVVGQARLDPGRSRRRRRRRSRPIIPTYLYRYRKGGQYAEMSAAAAAGAGPVSDDQTRPAPFWINLGEGAAVLAVVISGAELLGRPPRA